jgi:tetratricopeptide (TPR) repeat protein
MQGVMLVQTKSMRYSLLLYLFLLGFAPFAWGQSSDIDIAESYVADGECEIAVVYYEKIIKSNRTRKVYDNYKDCLLELQNYDEAIKLVKSFIKNSSNNALYQIDLGQIYLIQGDDEKAQKTFRNAIKDLNASQYQVISMANAFIKLNQLDLAYDTYLKGRKELDGKYTFHYELATLEGIRGNIPEMIDEYLDLINENPAYVSTVQNALGRNFDFTESNDKTAYLREALFIRVQDYPDNITYNEMLIWMLLQQNDFNAAFIQTRALDKRLGENGYRVLNLARIAKSNKDYKTSIKCYEYIAEKGRDNPYYTYSQTERIDVMQEEILESGVLVTEAVDRLDNEYRETIAILGKNENTVTLLMQWAHLKAYYQQESDTAIIMLESALNIPNVYPKVMAYVKLELADIYMLHNDIWEASLLYLQVDKDFKDDLIGHEAKFRNARLYYYTGNFGWSEAQLDVLKASTTKLIANNAMELSLLISDNLALDTITLPLEMYARADLLYLQHKDDLAIQTLDSISLNYPGHSLQDEIYFKKYQIVYRDQEFDQAKEYLEMILELYGEDLLADKAAFNLASLYENQFEDTEKASEYYELILMEYPNSLYVDDARKRFRELRGDYIN